MKNQLIDRTKRFAWLEIFEEILPEHIDTILILKKEGKELLAIIVASINTAKRNSRK